jgi:hypothetical protein
MKRHRHTVCASSARETLKVWVPGSTRCFPLHCLRLCEPVKSPWSCRRRSAWSGLSKRNRMHKSKDVSEPPLWSLIVRASLNQHFPNQWVGGVGPISWPARSPGISHCFFPMGIRKRLCVPNSGGRHQRFEGQQLTLTCCSVHGWSLNVAWTLYVWQMVPMLNACNVQNKLWEFLSQMTRVSMPFHKGFIRE